MNNKKIYVLYELTSFSLASDCGSNTFEIIGIYKEKSKAIKEKKNIVNNYLKDNYIIDNQCKDIKLEDNVILYWKHQKNWEESIEIIIQEFEIL